MRCFVIFPYYIFYPLWPRCHMVLWDLSHCFLTSVNCFNIPMFHNWLSEIMWTANSEFENKSFIIHTNLAYDLNDTFACLFYNHSFHGVEYVRAQCLRSIIHMSDVIKTLTVSPDLNTSHQQCVTDVLSGEDSWCVPRGIVSKWPEKGRNIVWLGYDKFSCFQNIHNRHPIACPHRQAMGCLLWVQTQVYIKT